MKNFTELELPPFALDYIEWGDQTQIGITTTSDAPDDTNMACGSLKYDWSKKVYENGQTIVPLRETELKEQDFNTVCSLFRGTALETVYDMLNERYKIGRVRLMKSLPFTCLSWHTDSQIRIHYPIKTQEGCFMVIGDEIMHLKQDTWYLTNTMLKHTAFNSSKEDRIHLVVNVLNDYAELSA